MVSKNVFIIIIELRSSARNTFQITANVGTSANP